MIRLMLCGAYEGWTLAAVRQFLFENWVPWQDWRPAADTDEALSRARNAEDKQIYAAMYRWILVEGEGYAATAAALVAAGCTHAATCMPEYAAVLREHGIKVLEVTKTTRHLARLHDDHTEEAIQIERLREFLGL